MVTLILAAGVGIPALCIFIDSRSRKRRDEFRSLQATIRAQGPKCGKPVKRRKYPTRGCERYHGHYGDCWLITPYDNERIPSTLTHLPGKRR